MSLATRCPHCNTIFKVVQDQLKVSEGWVRCGRCQQVFNALEGLFDMEREAPPQRMAPPPPDASSPVSARFGHEPAPPTATDPARDAPFPPSGTAPDTATAPLEAGEAAPAQASGGMDAPAPAAGVTQFDLDLPPSDEAVAAAMSALTQPAIQVAETDSYPMTDEADALESRYLLPSDNDDERRAQRRRPHGPDFADARFPADMMADAIAWDTAARPTEGQDGAEATRDAQDARSAEADAGTAAPGAEAAAGRPFADVPGTSAAPDAPSPPSPGTTLQRPAAGDDFRPEQSLPPPSQRPGKPGTRGRPQTDAPGFIKQAERKALWRNPTVRGLLTGLVLALAVLLAAQLAHHERDRLASDVPALRPWLLRWCALVECSISPPRRLEALQVDDVALVRTESEGEDTYRLSAIIHNQAAVALAWPRLDVTLTDPNGAVVVRRIFDAASAAQVTQGGSDGPVPATVPPNGSITLQWRLRAPGLQLAGYTVELFYP